MLRCLSELHKRGVVHMDVKPANLLLALHLVQQAWPPHASRALGHQHPTSIDALFGSVRLGGSGSGVHWQRIVHPLYLISSKEIL